MASCRRRRSCYTALTGQSETPTCAPKASGALENYQDANNQFKLAVAQNPEESRNIVCAGAACSWSASTKGSRQSVPGSPGHSEGLRAGLSRPGAGGGRGFSPKAVEFAQKAIELDPKLVEAQELLAYLALEDNDTDKAIKEADKAIAMSPEALDALAIRATIDWLNDKPASEWMDRICKINPVYGEAYSTAAHFFVINRRYEEGIAYYRKALELNPRAVGSARATGRQSDAAGRRDEAAQGTGAVLQRPLHEPRDCQLAAAARQLQELRHLQDCRPRSCACIRRKRTAAAVFPKRDWTAPSQTYEKKYQLKLTGRCRWKSIPITRTSRCAPWACRAWAPGRDVWNGGRDGQPVRPHAGQLSLGQHDVARAEPRLRADRDQASGAALVHRRPGGV